MFLIFFISWSVHTTSSTRKPYFTKGVPNIFYRLLVSNFITYLVTYIYDSLGTNNIMYVNTSEYQNILKFELQVDLVQNKFPIKVQIIFGVKIEKISLRNSIQEHGSNLIVLYRTSFCSNCHWSRNITPISACVCI